MSAGQFAFMSNEMEHMMQEMDSEFDEDNEEQKTVRPEMHIESGGTSKDEMSRSQSLAAKFNSLTIEEHVSSSSHSQAAFILGSSPTAAKANGRRPMHHVIISGDHTEVDDNVYRLNFNSHKVENNIIENSFRRR